MTKFKEYLRDKGYTLECDLDYLPCDGIEKIVVIPERAQLSVYHVSAGWTHVIIGKNGAEKLLYTNDDLYDADRAVYDRMEMRRLGLEVSGHED